MNSEHYTKDKNKRTNLFSPKQYFILTRCEFSDILGDESGNGRWTLCALTYWMRIKKNRDPIPENFKTLDEFDEFWSTHSLADYDDLQRDVHFNIQLDYAETIMLKPALVRELKKRARERQMSVDALVNSILEEKLKEAA